MKGGKILEEPTGIWVPIVFVWPVVSKAFIIPVIVLLLVFCLWALARAPWGLEIGIEDYPLFDVMHLFAFLAGG
ncbi:MAG: hypothetical protein Q8P74_02010 [bacterium]|nr:hypothetical protein [bacterium]